MTSTCEAATRVLPGAAVIELAGEVDGSAATVLAAAYEQAVGAAPDLGTVVLDFAAVDYINSTGIALIVSVLARARAERKKVVASGLSPHYREIFDITRLSDFIELFPDLDRAVSQLTPPAALAGRDSLSKKTKGRNQMSAPAIRMDVRRVGEKTAVVDIKGEVTAACEPVLMSAYEAAGGSATSRLVLNFAGLEYMNSGGIGMLVTLLVRANRQHQQLGAYGLSEHYREIFELTRLDEAITIYDSEESALNGVIR